MVKIYFEAETSNDYVSPISVANSLITETRFDMDDLEEIANHLLAYVRHHKPKED